MTAGREASAAHLRLGGEVGMSATMPVTDQDLRALTYLARRLRDETHGCAAWDEAGTYAVLKTELAEQSLPHAVERALGRATDPEAKTPFALASGGGESASAEGTCPAWCTDHIEMTDCSYHKSEDWLVHGWVLILIGPMDAYEHLNAEPAGVYFFKDRDPMPDRQLTVPEAEAKLLELQQDIARLTDVATTLRTATEHVRVATSCPIPEPSS
jgi:hypothetical protein